MCLHNPSGHNDRTHILQASDAHQHGRHGFITAGYEYASIEYCGIGLCLHQIRNGIAVCQGVIDSIVALGDTVTHISSKISGCLTAIFIHSLYRFFHEYIQMGGARMAVSVGAFHHDLRLGQITYLPAHSHTQRIHLRCQFSHFFTSKHNRLSFSLRHYKPYDSSSDHSHDTHNGLHGSPGLEIGLLIHLKQRFGQPEAGIVHMTEGCAACRNGNGDRGKL